MGLNTPKKHTQRQNACTSSCITQTRAREHAFHDPVEGGDTQPILAIINCSQPIANAADARVAHQ
eukprot:23131-Eustigmatos_ZCMA.PRE.1